MAEQIMGIAMLCIALALSLYLRFAPAYISNRGRRYIRTKPHKAQRKGVKL